MALPTNLQTLSLPVEGMTCASCVAHVEKALTDLPGTSNVSVNLATNKASLNYAPDKVAISQMQQAITDIGYQVPTDEINLQVTGMTCSSCVAHVEGALNGLLGVVEATVNLGLEKARVKYIPGVVTPAQMKRAVAEVGYQATEQSTAKDNLDRERQAARMRSNAREGTW